MLKSIILLAHLVGFEVDHAWPRSDIVKELILHDNSL